MKRTKKPLFRITKTICLVLVLWFLAETGITTLIGLRNNGCNKQADLLVVFGNKVNEDGSLSPRLKARLDKCLSCARKNNEALILVSGGIGKEGFAEGDKMAEYLLQSGISKNRLLIDNNGNNTLATLQNCQKIADSMSIGSIEAITQFYHKRRVLLTARNMGLPLTCVSAHYFELRDAYSLFREFFAVYKYRFIS